MSLSDLQQAAKAIAANRAAGEHPAPDVLASYHAGVLGADAEERVQHHLTSCRDCAGAVLDMASFPEIHPSEGGPITAGDTARNWQRFTERLDEEEQASSRDPAASPESALRKEFPPWWTLFASLRFAQTLAVLLLATSISLTVLLVRERGDGVRTNVQLAELTPDADPGERSVSTGIRLADSATGLLLILPLADPGETFELRIVARDTSRRLVRETITRTPDGRLTVELTPNLLRSGLYRAEIRSVDARQTLASYTFELRTE